MAHIAAIARSFPPYTRKTKKSTLEEINIEVEITDGKSLTDKDLKLLQDLSESIRVCTQQVDAPCNELHSEAFASDASRLVDGLGVPVQKTIIVVSF